MIKGHSKYCLNKNVFNWALNIAIDGALRTLYNIIKYDLKWGLLD